MNTSKFDCIELDSMFCRHCHNIQELGNALPRKKELLQIHIPYYSTGWVQQALEQKRL
jgi:hypothetical protein